MDASSAPWWVGLIAAPVAGSAAAAVAYVWKQREKRHLAEVAKADVREKAEQESRAARVAFLENALRESEERRHVEHNANRTQLIALLTAAREDAGDVREAVLALKDMPGIVREGSEVVLSAVKLAVREEFDRTSQVPPAPSKGTRR